MKLCYIKGNFAYFTSHFGKQWGDDWGIAPYEHNAGEPDDFGDSSLMKVAFETELKTPQEIAKSGVSYSVEQINNGEVPWLSGPTSINVSQLENKTKMSIEEILSTTNSVENLIKIVDDWKDYKVEIYAGVSLEDFCNTITELGGTVYMKTENFTERRS